MHVGIIGAGATGLAAGYFLAPKHKVVIFKAESAPAGLAGSIPSGKGKVEKFYHLLLPTDDDLIRLVADLGLDDDFR